MPATTIEGALASLAFAALLATAAAKASACEEGRIREVLLRHAPQSWEAKLEFVRERRGFGNCDFTFTITDRIDGPLLPAMTLDSEVRFRHSGKDICVERYDMVGSTRIGSTRRSEPRLKVCISSAKPRKPAQGRLLDLFKN